MAGKQTETNDFAPWREKMRHVIFDHNTPSSRGFDVLLLVMILASVLAIMLESVASFDAQWHRELNVVEWVFTVFFTIEYILRLVSSHRPGRYARSFFGIVDLLACLPTYIGLLFPEGHAEYLMLVRALRLLRIFRVLKMIEYIGEANLLLRSLRASRAKIIVFVVGVLILATLLGSLMYVVEAPKNEQFSSIPESIYWAIVTITTVGYGDISPTTFAGQVIATAIMITGYAIIAVPTGIITAEIVEESRRRRPAASGRGCPDCGCDGHEDTAKFCRKCGAELDPLPT